MTFLIEFGTLILTTYLALTNSLADFLVPSVVPDETSPEITLEKAKNSPELNTLTRLDSDYEPSGTIPDILLRNTAFQQANLLGSGSLLGTTSHSVAEATVNLYCTYTTDEYVRATTGSGFFVTPAGAILTNAHVAQFLLLEASSRTGKTECFVRTGNPAVAEYEAKLLYIPPAWISAHADLINAKAPRGTGERDYALLYASAGVDNQPLPARFPYLNLNSSLLHYKNINDSVTAAGYPATPLYEDGVDAKLPFVQANVSITDLFTFKENTADLMSLSESAVSTGGSSGGPITNGAGKAIGVIVTRGETESDSLRALTIPYINHTIEEETGLTLTEYLNSDLSYRAAIFEEALAPFLLQLLEWQLDE